MHYRLESRTSHERAERGDDANARGEPRIVVRPVNDAGAARARNADRTRTRARATPAAIGFHQNLRDETHRTTLKEVGRRDAGFLLGPELERLGTATGGFDNNFETGRYISREQCVDLIKAHEARYKTGKEYRCGLAGYGH